MRGFLAALLALALLPATAAAAGPPNLQAIVSLGQKLGPTKVTAIQWADAGRDGNLAFAATLSGGSTGVYQWRSSPEKPYGSVKKMGVYDAKVQGSDFTDDNILAYMLFDADCTVFRSVEGGAPQPFGKACQDPATGGTVYSRNAAGGAYAGGKWYFKSLFGNGQNAPSNAFAVMSEGLSPTLFSSECPDDVCRSVVAGPGGTIWAATQSLIYTLRGGAAQLELDPRMTFVDSWGLAATQVLVRAPGLIRIFNALKPADDLDAIRDVHTEHLCCGKHDGWLIGERATGGGADGTQVDRLVRHQRIRGHGLDSKATTIAEQGDKVLIGGKHVAIAKHGIDSAVYSSPQRWDGTAVFLAELHNGKTALVVRRADD